MTFGPEGLALGALAALLTALGPGAWTVRKAPVDEGPDLRVTNVFSRTAGGLCAGNGNTFQVMIRNESRVPVTEAFVVRLRIRLPARPVAFLHREETVLGLDGLDVKSVLFREVPLLHGLHAVTAIVDATDRVDERPAGAESNNGFPGAGQTGSTPNVTRGCGTLGAEAALGHPGPRRWERLGLEGGTG